MDFLYKYCPRFLCCRCPRDRKGGGNERDSGVECGVHSSGRMAGGVWSSMQKSMYGTNIVKWQTRRNTICHAWPYMNAVCHFIPIDFLPAIPKNNIVACYFQ